MGAFLNRVGKELKTIRGCFSVAMQQARQSEIDALYRRCFRERNGLGDTSPIHLRGNGLDTKELITRLGIGLRTFRSCCSETHRMARLSEIEVPARRIVHELKGAGPDGAGELVPILEEKVASKEAPEGTHVEGIHPPLVKTG